MAEWYFLDPDNRKYPDGLHCARCKKLVKDNMFVGFTSIVLHPEHPWFRKMSGHEAVPKHLVGLIGNDCLKLVIEKFGIVCYDGEKIIPTNDEPGQFPKQ